MLGQERVKQLTDGILARSSADQTEVVILAGGRGTRISEETGVRPKPMVEIGGRPILWHIMKIYSHYGFNEFVIALGEKQNIIKNYFYQMLNVIFALKTTIVNLLPNAMVTYQRIKPTAKS